MDDLDRGITNPGAGAPDRPGPEVGSEDVELRDVVLDTSTSLMSAEPDEFAAKLRWGLADVGEHVGADRAYLFRVDDDGFERTEEWTTDGVDPPDVRRIEPGEFEWLTGRLRRFENVVVTGPADVPGDADVRTLLRSDAGRVGSAVVCPLVSDWSLDGFVAFDAIGSRRCWTETEVDLLRTVGDMMGHSLARIERERTLSEQNERLETFASVISHDLRNPLNVVSMSLRLARDSGDLEHLDRAADAAGRMEGLIDQVLTLARQGRDVGETGRVALDRIVADAWETVETHAARLAFDGDLGAVEADADRLREAIENLIRNAVEHAGDDATVRVGRLDDESGVYVADDGPGIPEVDRADVFDHGYSTDDDGTGLGLAIVRAIVEGHGWTIRATESDAGGARFEIVGVDFV